MEVKEVSLDKHYESISKWWIAHKWQPIAIELLPATGFIIENVCAGFLYCTDSGMCICEWIISNPESTKEERSEGLNMVINAISKKAKDLGYKMVFTSVEHEGLIKRYENNGFKKTDLNMTNMIKVL